MLKIKILALVSILAVVAIVLNNSRSFSSSARNDDTLEKIAGYRTWAKITKNMIEVFNPAFSGG